MKVEDNTPNTTNTGIDISDANLLCEIALLQGMAVESNWKDTTVDAETAYDKMIASDFVRNTEHSSEKLKTRKNMDDGYINLEHAVSRKKARSRSYRICSKCGHWKDIGYFAQYHYGEDMTPISCKAPEEYQKIAYSGWCGCSVCVITNQIYNVEKPLNIRKQSKRGKAHNSAATTVVVNKENNSPSSDCHTPTSIDGSTDTEHSSNGDHAD